MGRRLRDRRRALLPGVQPDTQRKKFDPEAIYVQRWVPEFGGDDYPEPIVDHAAERNEALRRYGKIS